MLSTMLFDYQLDRHCSKTAEAFMPLYRMFDYQLDRHCSKTSVLHVVELVGFDYQLDRHCSKTIGANSLLRRDVQSNRSVLSML